MKRPTFTIAGLMVAILLVAASFAALRRPTPLMASLVFSILVAILAIAILLTFVRQGKSRAGYAGMAAFGLAYLHFAFVGGDPGYPAFITTAAIGRAGDVIAGTSSSVIHSQFGENYETSSTSFISRAVSKEFNRYAFGQVGHCLLALVFGGCGVVLGRWIAGRDQNSD